VEKVEKGGGAPVKRFVTLVTVALVGAAVLTQWQRVKELGRQVLNRRGEKVSVSASENKATVRRVFDEVFNQGNLSVVDELVAPDYVLHDPGVPAGELLGLEAYKEQWVSMFRTAFPDLRIVIDDQVAEGDKVASRYTGSGTHQGELRGFPPTNNGVEVTGTITSRFAEGKIVEEWNNIDGLGMMQQLGIVPPLEPSQGA
jgi:predicted ester cyclase